MSKLEISQRFDARGLSCPMPIVKTAQAMKTLAHGQFLEVLVVDRGPSSEFQVWANSTGNVLVSATAEAGVRTFVFQKK
jgi:tRNA 2-thiouridine synthesizing protein A